MLLAASKRLLAAGCVQTNALLKNELKRKDYKNKRAQMSNVTIVKGDLFSAPKGSIICHACNTYGVWGAGIAKQFAKRYPRAYEKYRQECQDFEEVLLGSCLLIEEIDYNIGCLFTSDNFGSNVDSVERILSSTERAISDLVCCYGSREPIHMCKINSGLFGVDWELTKKVLEKFPEQEFTVYEY